MACASCQKARAAVAGAVHATLRGDLAAAGQQASVAASALRDKATTEAARVRALLVRRKA